MVHAPRQKYTGERERGLASAEVRSGDPRPPRTKNQLIFASTRGDAVIGPFGQNWSGVSRVIFI